MHFLEKEYDRTRCHILFYRAYTICGENQFRSREYKKKAHMIVPSSPTKFVPALRFHAFTGIYDLVLQAVLNEQGFKRRLVRQSNLHPGHRVLDIGCGTGTLTLLVKRMHPEVTVVGLDVDPKALELARNKAHDAGLDVEFFQGSATRPPFEARTFDRVFASLMLHHLPPKEKMRALQAARHLLRNQGEIHIADWGKAQNGLMRAAFLPVQLLDGFKPTADHVRGLLPRYLEDAGFSSVQETHSEMTFLGTLSLYQGSL